MRGCYRQRVISDRERWVHVYEFGVREEPGARDWSLLSEEEQDRARCIRDPARRSRFVAPRAALREILSEYTCEVCFNCSHSQDVAVVAIAHRPVGVDIEVERPRRQERIAARMFAPDELAALDDLRGDPRRRLFHRCWVAKEAYAKGRGRGLGMPFTEFSVAPALRSPEGTGAVGEGWTVSVSTGGGRHLAVAAEGEDWEVVRRD
jgi:4'-phosphopantetheinyl transferase